MHHSPINVNMMAPGEAGLANGALVCARLSGPQRGVGYVPEIERPDIINKILRDCLAERSPLAFAQAAASIPHDALPCAAALAAALSHVLK